VQTQLQGDPRWQNIKQISEKKKLYNVHLQEIKAKER